MDKEFNKTCTHISFGDYSEVTILETIIVFNRFAPMTQRGEPKASTSFTDSEQTTTESRVLISDDIYMRYN